MFNLITILWLSSLTNVVQSRLIWISIVPMFEFSHACKTLFNVIYVTLMRFVKYIGV